jgi:hypothetical protein
MNPLPNSFDRLLYQTVSRMDSSMLTNRIRAQTIYKNATCPQNQIKRIPQGNATQYDYTNFENNLTEGAVFTPCPTSSTKPPVANPSATTFRWLIPPNTSDQISLTFVRSPEGMFYEAPLAEIKTSCSVTPFFGPTPPFANETKLSISNGLYTVRFTVSRPVPAQTANQFVGFELQCGTYSQTYEQELTYRID